MIHALHIWKDHELYCRYPKMDIRHQMQKMVKRTEGREMRIIPQRCDGGDKDHLFFIGEGHIGNTAECPTCHKQLPLLPHEINYLDGTGPQIVRQLRCTICNRTKNVFEFPAIDQRNMRTGICVECTFLHHITEAITIEPIKPTVVKDNPKKLRRGWRLKK